MSSALRELIAERIRREGPLSFAEFMRMGLYHPVYGYYASRVPGAGAGYRTSPTLTPLFGMLVGRALHRMWVAMGRPDTFDVVEIGGGRGDLAAAAWESLPPEQAAATRWVFVEPFEQVRRLQRDALAPLPLPIEWFPTLEESRSVSGCVIANEVLDNFPFRLFEVTDDGAREVCVAVNGERLVEEMVDPTLPQLATVQAIAAHLQVGDRFEIRAGIEDWCRSVSAVLDRGYMLVVDYGDTQPNLWLKRPSGTLMTYRGELVGEDPLENPGDVDITAHIDFSALGESARRAGLEPEPVATQRDFLQALGIDELLQELKTAETEARSESRHGDYVRLIGERTRVSALASRGGLGDFLVLLARAGVSPLGI